MNNRLLIINGPGLSDLSNYNETGYDGLTLDAVQQKCSETCEGLGLEMDFRQNNNKSELLSVLIEDIDNFDALIINPAGHSQASSIGLDMYSTVINKITNQGKLVVEVRIENIFKQGNNKPLQGPESGVGFVGGLGMHSYVLAIKAISKKLSNN